MQAEHQVKKKIANVSEEVGMDAIELPPNPPDELWPDEEDENEIQRKLIEERRTHTECSRAKAIFLSAGYVFSPTDEQLVDHYLRRMTLCLPFEFCPITQVDVYAKHPQSIIENSKKTPEPVWYFFTSSRPNLTEQGTDSQGHWVFGEKEDVFNQSEKIGSKQVLEYFEGDRKSEYKIIEYQLDPAPDVPKSRLLFICKLCKHGAL